MKQAAQTWQNILYKHWKKPYIGTSCDLLQNTIKGYEKSVFLETYSSCSVQHRKSRLTDEYGKICPMVTYVVRNDDHGFPPADPTIINVMGESPGFSSGSQLGMSWDPFDDEQGKRATNIWFHAISVGILQAILERGKSNRALSASEIAYNCMGDENVLLLF